MQRNVTTELGERDAMLAAEALERVGRLDIDVVQAWQRNPIEVEWDPQERFEEGVRLCSVAIQLRVALARLQADDTASPVTAPAAESSEPASRHVPVADNGELVTHEWRVGDEVHRAGYPWVDDWRGLITRLVDKETVVVGWLDDVPTHILARNLEADDGRQS